MKAQMTLIFLLTTFSFVGMANKSAAQETKQKEVSDEVLTGNFNACVKNGFQASESKKESFGYHWFACNEPIRLSDILELPDLTVIYAGGLEGLVKNKTIILGVMRKGFFYPGFKMNNRFVHAWTLLDGKGGFQVVPGKFVDGGKGLEFVPGGYFFFNGNYRFIPGIAKSDVADGRVVLSKKSFAPGYFIEEKFVPLENDKDLLNAADDPTTSKAVEITLSDLIDSGSLLKEWSEDSLIELTKNQAEGISDSGLGIYIGDSGGEEIDAFVASEGRSGYLDHLNHDNQTLAESTNGDSRSEVLNSGGGTTGAAGRAGGLGNSRVMDPREDHLLNDPIEWAKVGMVIGFNLGGPGGGLAGAILGFGSGINYESLETLVEELRGGEHDGLEGYEPPPGDDEDDSSDKTPNPLDEEGYGEGQNDLLYVPGAGLIISLAAVKYEHDPYNPKGLGVLTNWVDENTSSGGSGKGGDPLTDWGDDLPNTIIGPGGENDKVVDPLTDPVEIETAEQTQTNSQQ